MYVVSESVLNIARSMRAMFFIVFMWPPSPHPLIDHVAHYKSKAAVALLQVANEGSFLTSLNGPDKESNEEINNLAIVALLILIHPACWAWIQWKAGYFSTVQFLCISMFFLFVCYLGGGGGL